MTHFIMRKIHSQRMTETSVDATSLAIELASTYNDKEMWVNMYACMEEASSYSDLIQDTALTESFKTQHLYNQSELAVLKVFHSLGTMDKTSFDDDQLFSCVEKLEAFTLDDNQSSQISQICLQVSQFQLTHGLVSTHPWLQLAHRYGSYINFFMVLFLFLKHVFSYIRVR